MQKLESLSRYQELVSEIKTKRGKIFSNIYLLPETIQKYINENRIYYSINEDGLILYLDEKKYYKVYLYVINDKFDIKKENDKYLYIRNVFAGEKRNDRLLAVSGNLEKLGFEKVETTIQIRGNTFEIGERYASIEKFIYKMEREGYKCLFAKPCQYSEIEKFIFSSGMPRDYHCNYKTIEEKQNMEEGSYLYIVDKNNQLCATSIAEINEGVYQGSGIAVREELKLRGISTMLSYYRNKWLRDKGINTIIGWILLENEESLKYHQSMGYHFTNKFADGWLLK